ncbi:hypothetical protein ACHAXT_013118 [Thalassiosira profunda]
MAAPRAHLPREDYPPMPRLTITSEETLDKCASLPLRPSDVFICSYPKSGTTWTQHIMLSLLLADRRGRLAKLNGGVDGADGSVAGEGGQQREEDREEDLDYEHVSDFSPFFEIDAHWEATGGELAKHIRGNHERLGRRVFNTHLRWDMLPKRRREGGEPMAGGSARSGNHSEKESSEKEERRRLRPACGKFLYVTRHLQDSCASFYHHLSNQKEGTYTKGFAAFATDWMAGDIPFGSPVHHLLSFAEGFADNEYAMCDEGSGETGQRPLLLLSYERMKSDLRAEVSRIVRFLQLDCISDEALDALLPTFSFREMRGKSSKFQPRSVTWLNEYQFLRKGVAGDGRRLFAETDDGRGRSLDEAFRHWVEREGYRAKIEGLREHGLEGGAAEGFLGVVR